MVKAIVTGATGMFSLAHEIQTSNSWFLGILGRELVNELASQKWSTIYAMSRSKKDEYPDNVSHSHLDLTGSAQEIAKELKGIEAEYIFFAAYLANSDEAEATRINGE